MLKGAEPTRDLVYNRWPRLLGKTLQEQGTLFKEIRYAEGPTGHFNGHTAAMTGAYTYTGLNLNVNPAAPTVFEYYRKHTDPSRSALNAWWLSEGLGPYPSLNYSSHSDYGAQYGANYLNPISIIGDIGQDTLSNLQSPQPKETEKVAKIKAFLDANFKNEAVTADGIYNQPEDRERIKNLITEISKHVAAGTLEVPLPAGASLNELNGDLVNLAAAWQVLNEFAPELMVVNTFNSDICHSNFTNYIRNMHKADYGVAWLWDKVQKHPKMANNTVMIVMPEHGRNLAPNNLFDSNGLAAFDHTSDANSRRSYAMVVGPTGKVKQGHVLGSENQPIGQSIDIIPTIGHILGFKERIPGGMLAGSALTQAFA